METFGELDQNTIGSWQRPSREFTGCLQGQTMVLKNCIMLKENGIFWPDLPQA